jgi:hypothetical protein
VSAAVMPSIGANFKGVERVMVAAVVGGTVSEISGGKFANGAMTAAFQAAATEAARSGKAVRTGGREVIIEEIRKIVPNASAAEIEAILNPSGATTAIPLRKDQVTEVLLNLTKLADAQGISFWGPDEHGYDLFGPERVMLARAAIGWNDVHTIRWWQHEVTEAAGVFAHGGMMKSGYQYRNLVATVHNGLVAQGIQSDYTPAARALFSYQSFPRWDE